VGSSTRRKEAAMFVRSLILTSVMLGMSLGVFFV